MPIIGSHDTVGAKSFIPTKQSAATGMLVELLFKDFELLAHYVQLVVVIIVCHHIIYVYKVSLHFFQFLSNSYEFHGDVFRGYSHYFSNLVVWYALEPQ